MKIEMGINSLPKNKKIGFIGIFLVFLIFFSAFQINSPINTDENAFENNTDDKTILIPNNQDSYELTKLPFFNNSTSLLDWLNNNMTDISTLPESPSEPNYPMFYAESDKTGDNILDNNHYLEDFAMFLNEYAEFQGKSNYQIIEYYGRLKTLGFWDSSIGEEGYYTSVNGDWTSNSTIKEVKGNAQLMLPFLEMIINDEESADDAETIVIELWNDLTELFWDASTDTMNHSSVDSDKYMEDQFITAIVGFLINRADISDIKTDALNKAELIMGKMLDQESLHIYENEGFDYKRDEDLSNPDQTRFLKTNAYGIWALLEYFLESDVDNYKNIAEDVFIKLNDTLRNSSSYSLFMSESTEGGVTIINDTIRLEDNSIMMIAVKSLFEITGNFTYFRVYMDMFNSIQENFKDPIYGTYYVSIKQGLTSTNTNKNFGDHSYLVRSLSELESIAKQSNIGLDINSTDIIKDEENEILITSDYYFALSIDEVPIENATIFITIRNSDSKVIYNSTIEANSDGSVELVYNITDLGIDSYSVSIRANYTGAETRYISSQFSILSGVGFEECTLQSNQIMIGGVESLNISLINDRLDNLTVSLNIEGEDIIDQTISNQFLENETVNHLGLIEIEVENTASLGESTLIVEVFNNSQSILVKEITFTLISSLEIASIKQDSKGFIGKSFEIEIDIENKIDSSISIITSISGEFIQDISQTHEITSIGIEKRTYSVNIDSDSPFGSISYSVVIKRSSDDEVIYEKDFTIIIENSLEFQYIELPDISYHGQEIVATCSILNNMDNRENITTYINEEEISTELLISGENIFNILLDEVNSPYNLGIKTYEISIKDDEGNIIYQDIITTQIKSSLGSILLGYILPVLIPIIGVVVLKHISVENKKRLS